MANHLYFICGLPAGTDKKVCSALKQHLPGLDFSSLPAQRISPKYTAKYLDTILRNLADYIVKHRQNLPETISLLVVDDIDIDFLYKYFFPFIRILKCSVEKIYDIDKCIQIFMQAIKAHRPIEEDSLIFLPIYNFETSTESAEALFMDFYSGKKTLQELQGAFPRKKFNSGDLPHVLHGTQRKVFHMDKRELVFPPCKPTEEHGDIHELPVDGRKNNHSLLAAFYRFGILKGSGFHYDVQRTGDKKLNTVFYCKKREQQIQCAREKHVNIYLNDFIRTS